MITLLLGGARSGKSGLAERLLADAELVTVVVSGRATDPDMAARIAAHRARRPSSWATVEAGEDLPTRLAMVDGPVLVDSLGTWVSAFADLTPPVSDLIEVLRARRAPRPSSSPRRSASASTPRPRWVDASGTCSVT